MTHINNTVMPGLPKAWSNTTADGFKPGSNHTVYADNRVNHADLPVETGKTHSLAVEPPPVMTRPEPVVATETLLPASSSPQWDSTVLQALKTLPDPDGWAQLARGAGLLSGTQSTVQQAESRLQSSRLTTDAQLPEVRNPLGHMKFRVTLESGAQVTFEVTASQGYRQSRSGSMSFRAIDVSYESKTELTEAEQKALDQFSIGLGRFAGDFARNGSPNVSLLNLTDSPLLSKVSLSMQVQTTDGKTHKMALAYHSDANARQLDLRWNLRALSMTVDAGSALTDAALAEALGGVQQSISRSLGHAKASLGDQRVLLNALSLFKAGSDEPAERTSLPAASRALLTSLPDYNIRFKGAATVPEGLQNSEHFQKYSGVRLFELGQTSRITEKDGRLTLDQSQWMSLNAAYFTALPHLERPDFKHQNFNWTVIKERHEVTTRQTWEDNELVTAQMWRSSESTHVTETWSEGEQIDKVANNLDRQQLDDLTEWLKMLSKDDADPSVKTSEQFTMTHYWIG